MANVKLASAGENVKLWETNNFSLHHEYCPHANNVNDISWSHDGQFLASTCVNGDNLTIAYIKSDSFSVAEISCKNEQQSICFSKNTSRHLLTGGKNGEINLWDLKLYQLKKAYLGHVVPITKVQFNWNDTVSLSGNLRGDIILHNVTTGMASSPLRAPKVQAIRDLKYSVTKRSLFASASDDGVINLWDSNTRHMVHSFKDAHGAPAMALAFSPVNDMLLTSVGLDKHLLCFDVKSKTSVKNLMCEHPFTSVDFHHDGVTLAAGTTRGKIFVYDLRQTSSPIRSLTAHKTSVQCVMFQPYKPNVTTSSIKIHGSTNSNRSASLSPKRLLANAHQVNSASCLASSPNTSSASHIPQLANKPTIKKCLEVNGVTTVASVDTLGTGDVSGQDSFTRVKNLSDDIFSPLREDSVFDKPTIRKQPIGGGGSKLLGDRPITAGLEDNETIAMLNGSLQDSLNRPLSPPSAPRRRSASFSPRTSRNLAQERTKEHDHSGSTNNNVIVQQQSNHVETPHSPTSRLPVRQTKREVPLSIVTSSPAQVPSTAAVATTIFPNPEASISPQAAFAFGDDILSSLKDFIRRQFEEAVEELQESNHRSCQQLRVDIVREFQIQKAEIEALLQKYSINDDLLLEVERLREENKKLLGKF